MFDKEVDKTKIYKNGIFLIVVQNHKILVNVESLYNEPILILIINKSKLHHIWTSRNIKVIKTL